MCNISNYNIYIITYHHFCIIIINILLPLFYTKCNYNPNLIICNLHNIIIYDNIITIIIY